MSIGINNALSGTTWCSEIDGYVNWLAGEGVPDESLGQVSDFYFDLAERQIYQKTEAGWGEPVLGDEELLAENVFYSNPAYASIVTVKDALDELLYYPPVATLTLDVPGGTTQEIGAVVDSAKLTWSFNKHVEDVTLTDVGTVPEAGSHEFADLNLTTNKTWTISGKDDKNTTSRSATVVFRHKRYWGTSPEEALDTAGILALNKEFATARTQTRSMSGGGAYLYFAYPKAWGTAAFKVNGLDNSAWTEMEVEFTNASGHTEVFYVYRTDTVQFGSGLSVQVL